MPERDKPGGNAGSYSHGRDNGLENIAEILLPDDYTGLFAGNANTGSDRTFGDFVYEQHRIGNRIRNVRRPVIEDQTGPPPYPENTADPQTSLEDMELQNGTHRHRENTLPSLQQKIDEAEAILAARARENEERSEDREHRRTQRHSR